MDFVLNGSMIKDMPSIYDEVQRTLCPDLTGFGRNLDALNNVLRGGVGVFESCEKVEIHWINSAGSKEALGTEQFEKIVDIIRDNQHELGLE